ncbi:MAG: hypothetical protein RLY31_1120, partial [Bacteroidota bacterium]
MQPYPPLRSLRFLLHTGFLTLWLAACRPGGTGEPDRQPPAQSSANDLAATTVPAPSEQRRIVFFGNSLTAAYGIAPGDGYVALLQQRLDSLQLPYLAVNAGLSGETSAGGRQRITWILRDPVDIFVLELGGNDALRGIDPADTYDNLSAILLAVRNRYPEARLV